MGELFAGHYELVDLVGLGNLGAVWRAWDHRQQTYVAAKIVRQPDASGLLRFIRESSASLQHRHLLIPRAWAGADEQVLFSTDLIRGGSAASLLLERGPLPAPWVAVVLDQLLEGLGALHDTGVVHGDIRTGRLLLEPTGRDRPHVFLNGFSAVSDGEPRTDLYGVGMVAAEMLTGLAPDPRAGVGPAPLTVPDNFWRWVRRLASSPAGDTTPGESETISATLARAELADLDILPPSDAWPLALMGVIDVPDRLGELPVGWAPDGPGPREGSPEPVRSVYDDLPTLPRVPLLPEPSLEATLQPSIEPEPEPLAAASRGRNQLEHEPDLDDEDGFPSLEPVGELPTIGDRFVGEEFAGEEFVGEEFDIEVQPGPEMPPAPEPSPELEPRPERIPAPGRAAKAQQPEPTPTRQTPMPRPRSDEPEPSRQPVGESSEGPERETRVEPLSQRAWQVRQLGDLERPPEGRRAESDLPDLDLDEEPSSAWRRWLLILFGIVVLLGAGYGIYLFVQTRT